MLANPMLAFISSVGQHRRLRLSPSASAAPSPAGAYSRRATAARARLSGSTAASLVKPAGIQMIAALIVTVLIVWLWFEDE